MGTVPSVRTVSSPPGETSRARMSLRAAGWSVSRSDITWTLPLKNVCMVLMILRVDAFPESREQTGNGVDLVSCVRAGGRIVGVEHEREGQFFTNRCRHITGEGVHVTDRAGLRAKFSFQFLETVAQRAVRAGFRKALPEKF